MKTMTRKQLGGACETKFTAASFEEIAELSKKHGTEMFQKGDGHHLEAMKKMKELMQDNKAMQQWYENKRREFESLPED
ncbi:MAG: DUF1059 domain-containing protein [Bacteroidota bacterium]